MTSPPPPHIIGAKNLVSSPTSDKTHVVAENQPKLSATRTPTLDFMDDDCDDKDLRFHEDYDSYEAANQTIGSYISIDDNDNGVDDDDDDDLQIINLDDEDDEEVEEEEGKNTSNTSKIKEKNKMHYMSKIKTRVPLDLEKVSLPRFSSNIDLETIEKNGPLAGKLSRAGSTLLQKFNSRETQPEAHTPAKHIAPIIILDSDSDEEEFLEADDRKEEDLGEIPLSRDAKKNVDISGKMVIKESTSAQPGIAKNMEKQESEPSKLLSQPKVLKSLEKSKQNSHTTPIPLSQNNEQSINILAVAASTESEKAETTSNLRRDSINRGGDDENELQLENIDMSESQSESEDEDENNTVFFSATTHSDGLNDVPINTDADESSNNSEQKKSITNVSASKTSLELVPEKSDKYNDIVSDKELKEEDVPTNNNSAADCDSDIDDKKLEDVDVEEDESESDDGDSASSIGSEEDDDDDDDDFFFGDYLANSQPESKSATKKTQKDKNENLELKNSSEHAIYKEKKEYHAKGRDLRLSSVSKLSKSVSPSAPKGTASKGGVDASTNINKLLSEDDLLAKLEVEKILKDKKRQLESSIVQTRNDNTNEDMIVEDDALLRTAKRLKKASENVAISSPKKTTERRVYVLLIVSKLPELEDKTIEVRVYGDQTFESIFPKVLASMFMHYERSDLVSVYFKENLSLYRNSVKLQSFMTLDSLGIPPSTNDDLVEVRLDLVPRSMEDSRESHVLKYFLEEQKSKKQSNNKPESTSETSKQNQAWEDELEIEQETPKPIARVSPIPEKPVTFSISLASSDNKRMSVNVTKTTKMQNLAAYYIKQKQLPLSSKIAFCFDHETIPLSSSIGDLDIEEDDMLEVIIG